MRILTKRHKECLTWGGSGLKSQFYIDIRLNYKADVYDG